MSKPLLTLPCKYSINDFSAEGNGNYHCSSCDRVLTDFRTFEAEEISKRIREASEKTCGIFRPDQVAARRHTISLGLRSQLGLSLLGILGFVGSSLLTSCETPQQSVEKSNKDHLKKEENAFSRLKFPMNVNGTITDKLTKKAVNEAKIRIVQNGKDLVSVLSGKDGTFSLDILEGMLSETRFDLIVERQHYINDTLHGLEDHTPKKLRNLTLTLEAKPAVCIPVPGETISVEGDVMYIENVRHETMMTGIPIPDEPEQQQTTGNQ